MNNVVSVIIPCFNQARFLDLSVGSVLDQTYQDFEIIIVNDGSTDPESISILQNYQKPCTKVIHISNHGLAEARNIGITEATGRYILPLDADDKIAPTYLEKGVAILETNKNAGIVYCEAEFFGGKTGKWPLEEFQLPRFLVENSIFCSAFFRKEDWAKVGGYSSKLQYGFEDYDLWLSFIELGREVVRIPEVLFFYRYNVNSMSKKITIEQRQYSFLQLIQRHPNLYKSHLDYIVSYMIKLQLDNESLLNKSLHYEELSKEYAELLIYTKHVEAEYEKKLQELTSSRDKQNLFSRYKNKLATTLFTNILKKND
jgi:glycosyltransferase involved in cell wall biosynthesis